jgi:probable F420-dependent oxidoreductase
VASIPETGLWSGYDRLPIADAIGLVQRAEALGYGMAWTQEGVGREPFALLGALATKTERIGLGVGIAQTTARDALAAHAGAMTVHELSGGRMVMGIGVGHQEIEQVRGHAWRPPLTVMHDYLEAYRSAAYRGPAPHGEPPVVIAALRTRMMRLAAEEADGAFLYCVPVRAVEEARTLLDEATGATAGRDRSILVVSCPVRLDSDREAAHSAARRYLDRYLGLPNYLANLRRLGFGDDDLAKPGSDALVDALVACGDEDAARERLQAYRSAGADHVALIPLTGQGSHADAETTERLAPPWW